MKKEMKTVIVFILQIITLGFVALMISYLNK
jgi:hypothetical protein